MKRMLADVCPELINEWSQRNLPLTPDSVTHGSNKIVWWNGKCGHEWRASIKNRVISGSGCPYCSHNAILEGYNDLASQKPELAAEWSDRNTPLLPTQVLVLNHRISARRLVEQHLIVFLAIFVNYFRVAVLPTEPTLEAEILDPKKISYCKDCKLPFVKRRYNQLFCEKCAKLRYKKQQAEYARKRRLNSRKSDS